MIVSFAMLVATVVIVGAGFCIMFNLPRLGWRLFGVGVVLAASAGFIPGQFG